jgi:hypothetical protein
MASANARALLMYLCREEVPPCPESGTRGLNAKQNHPEQALSLLGENYPDPFTGKTVIPYTLPEGSAGILVVKDITGKETARYLLKPEEKSLEIECREWKSGIYFYGLELNGVLIEFRKMVKTE